MGTTLSKLFGNGNKKSNGAEPGAGQSATLPRPTTSKVKVDVPKKSSSFRIPFPKKSKTPSPAVTPTIPPKNQENAAAPSPAPALNVIEVQIDEEAFKKGNLETSVETKITETVTIVKTELESVIEDVKNEGEENVENAVVKIQAGVRGFLTRKHMKEGSSPDKELIGECFDNDKRIETPTPSSPLKTTFTLLESIPQQEERPEVPLEELEILKKVQEINQLLAKDDDDEQFKMLESVEKNVEQSADTVINTVENVLNALDANIQEAEKEEPVVIESAFSEAIDKTDNLLNEMDVKEEQIQIEELEQGSGQQVPIHVTKSPSIEQEEEDERQGLSEEAAAIRIQAAFRGYGVRKSLSREPSPGREKIEDDAKALTEEQEPEPEKVDENKQEVEQEVQQIVQQQIEQEPEPEKVEEIKQELEQEVQQIPQQEVEQEPEPIVEETVTKTAETFTTESAVQPETESAPIEEESIVPVIVEHEKPEGVAEDMPEQLPVSTESTVISDDNKHEIEKLEALVSDDILSDTVKQTPVPDSEPDNVPHEPIEEEPCTKLHVEHEAQASATQECQNTVPESVPEVDAIEKTETKPVEQAAAQPEVDVSEENKETIQNKKAETKPEETEENIENKSDAQTIENVIESMEDNKDSLVMRIKIGVENQADNGDENKCTEKDESDEDVSASLAINRESSPAASSNKRRNRKNKSRKR